MDFNRKQRFSLRKLTVGVASVLLGTFVVANSHSVAADSSSTTDSSTVTKAEETSASSSVVVEGVTNETFAGANDTLNIPAATAPATEAAAAQETKTETSVKAETATTTVKTEEKAATSTATSSASSTTTATSTPAAKEEAPAVEAKKEVAVATPKAAQTNVRDEVIAAALAKADAEVAASAAANKVTDAAVSETERERRRRLAFPNQGKDFVDTGLSGSYFRSADAAISTSGENVTLPSNDTVTPIITDANGATISTRQPADPVTYKLNPAQDKYTFYMASLDGGAQASGSANTNRYIRFSKSYDDSTTTTVELVDKTTGNVVETQTLALGQTITLRQTNNSNYFLKLTSTESTSTSGRKYNVINGSFRDANDKSLSSLQMHVRYDVLANAKVGEKIDQLSTQIPKTAEQVTYYKEINPDNPTYDPNNLSAYVGDHTNKEVVISKFTQKAMEGQIYTPSQKREFTDANGKKAYLYASNDLRSEVVVGLTYNVGDKYVQFSNADSQKEKISSMIRTVEFTKADGTAKIAVYLIKPESARQIKGVAQGQLPDDNYVKIAEVEVAPDKYNDLTIPLTDTGLRGDNGDALYFSTEAFNGRSAGIITWGDATHPTQISVKNTAGNTMTIGGTRSRLVNDNTKAAIAFYYYAPVGNVTVHYEDTNGNVIKDPIVITEDNELAGKPVKTDYTTVPNRDTSITKDGKVYKLVSTTPKDGSATETGKVEKGNKDVTYVYEELKNNVKINYVDLDGKAIKGSQNVFKTSQSANTPYDATTDTAATADVNANLKPAKITVNGTDYVLTAKTFMNNGTAVNSSVKDGSAPTTGTVAVDSTKDAASQVVPEITYVYEPVAKKGNVDVKYIAEDGTVLEDTTSVKKDAPVGEAYTTTQKTFDGYEFVKMDPTSAPANGTVKEEDQHVIYVYKKKVETPVEKKGSVVVKYVIEGTNTELQNPYNDTTDKPVGTPYNTEENDNERPTEITKGGKTYELVPTATIGNPTGNVVEGTTTVTYQYKEKVTPVVKQQANVIVVAVDAAGKPLTQGRTEAEPNNTKASIPDGVLKEVTFKDGDAGATINTDNQFDKDAIIAAYQKLGYEVVSGGYTDKDGNPRTEYTGSEVFDNVEGNVQRFVIKLTPKTVPFTPDKPVKPGEPVPNLPGDPTYPTPNNPGDPNDPTPNNPTDPTKPETLKATSVRTVTYYTENKDGSNRQQIAESEIPTKENTLYYRQTGTVNLVTGEVTYDGWKLTDSNYTQENSASTGDFNLVDVPAKAGYTPSYVEKDGSTDKKELSTAGVYTGVEAGKTLADKVIYVKDDEPVTPEVKKGSVVVKYVIEGTTTELQDPYNDTTDKPVGTEYDTTGTRPNGQPERPTELTKDGKTYVLVPTSTIGNPTGTVTEGTTEVTYQYKLKEETPAVPQKADVVVVAVDAAGNPLTKGRTSAGENQDIANGILEPVMNLTDGVEGGIINEDGKFNKDAIIAKYYKLGYKFVEGPYGSADEFKDGLTFDGVEGNVQHFVVKLTPIVVPVTPEVPVTPGKEVPNVPTEDTPKVPDPGTPTYPNPNPNDPKDPETPVVKDPEQMKGTKTRIVKYYKEEADGSLTELASTPGFEDKTDTLNFEKKGTINLVTGETTLGNWEPKNGTEFNNYTSPTLEGYTPDKTEEGRHTGITEPGADIVDKVIYRAKPVTPPTPEVVKQLADVTVVAVKADGTPLLPSEDLGKQVKDATGLLEKSSVFEGQAGEKVTGFDRAAAIAKYQSLGYKYVPGNKDGFEGEYTGNNVYDSTEGNTQHFVIKVTPVIVPVTPEVPVKPGDPVPNVPSDPNNPDPKTPNYPEPKDPDTKDPEKLKGTSTRVVKYFKKEADGTLTPLATTHGFEDKTDVLNYEKTGTVNLVTGETTLSDWTPKNGTEFKNYTSPELAGYTPDKTAAGEHTGITTPGQNLEDIVIYTPNPVTPPVVEEGTVVVNYKDTEGNVIKDPVTDTPTSPVKTPYDTTDNKPTEITDKDGNKYKLVPNLTEGNEKGEVVKGETKVTYVYQLVQQADVTVIAVDENGKPLTSGRTEAGQNQPLTDGKLDVSSIFEGAAGENVTGFDREAAIKKYQKLGYKYVPGNATGYEGEYDGTNTYDNKKGNVQHFVIKVTPVIVPVTPEVPVKPGDPVPNVPNDPNNPTPETPTYPTPDKPNTPTDPNGTVPQDLKGTKTRIVQYFKKEADGSLTPLASTPGFEDKSDTLNFEKKGTINLVTGKVEIGNWEPKDGTTFNDKVSPTLPGYTPDFVVKGFHSGITEPGEDIVDKVIYTPVVTPTVPMQKADVTYLAVDKNGNPLQPGDDVAKQVKDATGLLEKSAELTGENGSKINYTTADIIKKYEKLGYELVSSDYPTNPLFDNDENVDQHFTVKLTPKIVPFEPNKPVKPNEPVDPNDPDSPNYPDPKDPAAKDPNSLKAKSTRVVTYYTEDKDGNNRQAIATTEIPTDTKEEYFRRTGTVNLVTGEVTLSDWTVTDSTYDKATTQTTVDFAKANVPVKEGYIVSYVEKDVTTDKPNGDKTTDYSTAGTYTGIGANVDKADKVVYIPISKYIPKFPPNDTPEDPWKEVPYTNDPNDPGKIVPPTSPEQPPIPYVPGYTPKDPGSGEPLKPKDPSDPSKGYEPPKPNTPVDPTEIPYERNGNVVVSYVIQGTTDKLQEDYKDTTDKPVGTPYNTTEGNERPNEITKDGKTYVLVSTTPKEGEGKDKGTVVPGTTTVTYEYKLKETPVTPPVVEEGTVVVNYKDTEGNVIKDPVTDTPTSPVKTPYDTTDNKPTEITDKDGNKYKLVPNLTEGNETGEVVKGETKVTYVYQLVQQADVTVIAVDENGKPLTSGRTEAGQNQPLTDGKLDVSSIFEGAAGETVTGYDRAAVIAKFQKLGYKYVPGTSEGYEAEYNGSNTYDNKKGNVQHFVIKLTPVIVPVTPEVPVVPGKPVPPTVPGKPDIPVIPNDPNNPTPETPTYPTPDKPNTPTDPNGTVPENLKGTKTRIVKYYKIDENGNKVPLATTPGFEDKSDTLNFEKKGTINLVTGKVEIGNWEPKDGTTFNDKVSPELTGYTPDFVVKGFHSGITEPGEDIVDEVIYRPVVVPVVPKQKADVTYLAVDKDGKPLQPGSDVAKQVKDATGLLEKSAELTGDNGEKITYTTAEIIKKYEKLGYKLVTTDYTDGKERFDNDANVDQHFTVKLTPIIVPFEPNKPVKPNEPVDPNDPDSPNYPDPKDPAAKDPNSLKATSTRVVTYWTEDKDGQNRKQISESEIATLTNTEYFRRTGTINLVTGEVTFTNWTVTDSTYSKETSETTVDFAKATVPVKKGYIAVYAEKDSSTSKVDYNTAGTYTGIGADKHLADKVIYVPISNYYPKWPNNGNDVPPTPWTEVPYTNDPNDPGKIVPPTNPEQPQIPYVPGYTPKDPGTGEPLKPVDPTDPKKGYIPPVPTNPLDPTPIPYDKDPEPKPDPKDPTPPVPGKPVTPPATPDKPAKPVTPAPQLPSTGEETNSAALIAAAVAALGAAGLVAARKKDEE